MQSQIANRKIVDSAMWKSEGGNDRREAASAVRQGVLRGKRRLAAVAIGASLGIAAIVAVYLAWSGAATMHDGEGAVATRHGGAHDGEGGVATRQPPPAVVHDGEGAVATRHGPPVAETNAPARKGAGDGYVKRAGQLRLPDGQVLTFPPPAEGETRLVHAYGHTYECDHLGNFRDITPRRLFDTAFEANFFALAQSEGRFIPAFLTGLDEADVKAMLVKGYTPKGDETEEEMARLKAYDEMRCAVLEYMEQGGRFDDFVSGVADFEREQRQARAAGLREVMTLVKQGRVEEARRMAEEADRLLREKGFAPIRLPAHVREAFGVVE